MSFQLAFDMHNWLKISVSCELPLDQVPREGAAEATDDRGDATPSRPETLSVHAKQGRRITKAMSLQDL